VVSTHRAHEWPAGQNLPNADLQQPQWPGAYRGFVDLDEQLVGPGGMALGDQSWANREVGSITVAVSPKTVRLGAVIDPPPLKIAPVTLLDEITLEPRVPGSAGVGLTPAPASEDILVRGQWNCS
jgi:hypothetical protein